MNSWILLGLVVLAVFVGLFLWMNSQSMDKGIGAGGQGTSKGTGSGLFGSGATSSTSSTSTAAYASDTGPTMVAHSAMVDL